MLARNSRKYMNLGLLTVLMLVASAACLPEISGMFVSMDGPGITQDDVEYDANDILFLEETGVLSGTDYASNWQSVFDGELYGLTDAKHDISAFSFNEMMLDFEMTASELDEGTELYLSFEDNRARVPGIPGWVYGQDVVKFTMGETTGGTVANTAAYSYEMYFDGSDVSLTTNSEKIDGLSVWPPENYELLANDVELPVDCNAGVIFISTGGSYRVTDNLGGHLVGDGSDVLAFCATNTGPDTAGFWFRVFESSEAGVTPRNAIRSLDVWGADLSGPTPAASDSGNLDLGISFLFTVKQDFEANGVPGPDPVVGGPNDLFAGFSDNGTHSVKGPYGNFNDGLEVPPVNGVVESVSIINVYPITIP